MLLLIEDTTNKFYGTKGQKSIDFRPLVPQKSSVETSNKDHIQQKSTFNVHTY